jgi:saccharopine dehydrogenase-like NADP-dependent oxidoreductase
VLGAGVIGEAIAWDLTQCRPLAKVTLADIDPTRLSQLPIAAAVDIAALDVRTPDALARLASDHDVVVGALPSRYGYAVMRTLCEIGARYCDVSFIPEDAASLHALAVQRGAVVVHDCGVAPGLSHVLVGEAVADLSTVESVRIDVGGLPERPAPPFFYKAPFAASDVLEEYTRPVRLVRDGQSIVVEALSGVETLQVEGVGALDSFLTDGLRSLVATVASRQMEERTLRHPGHLPIMIAMRDAGFLSTQAVEVGGQLITPRDLSSSLLFPLWAYAAGERDVTVLRVLVTGRDVAGDHVTNRWVVVDRPDAERTGHLSSMARTTAFPAAIVARWLADGSVAEPGVHAPETLGLRGMAPGMLDALHVRGVEVSFQSTVEDRTSARRAHRQPPS